MEFDGTTSEKTFFGSSRLQPIVDIGLLCHMTNMPRHVCHVTQQAYVYNNNKEMPGQIKTQLIELQIPGIII